MGAITTIGLDLAKNVFQDHGIDADGQVLIRRGVARDDRDVPPAQVSHGI